MKLIEIMDKLTRHREHYRALPEKAQLALGALIKELEEAIDAENREVKNVVAEGTEENKAVSKRPYRKRVERRDPSAPV